MHSTGGGQLTGAAELGGSESPKLSEAHTRRCRQLVLQDIAKFLQDSGIYVSMLAESIYVSMLAV